MVILTNLNLEKRKNASGKLVKGLLEKQNKCTFIPLKR